MVRKVIKSKPQGPAVQAIPDWAKAEQPSGIVWTGVPFQYRADGSQGQFLMGGELVGPRLECAVFDHRFVSEARWVFTRQAWMDLAFIDRQNRPSILPLKKDGLMNLCAWMDTRIRQGVQLGSQWLTLQLSEKFNAEEEAYWVVDVVDSRFVNYDEYLQIVEFRKSRQFEWLLTGEIGG